MGTRLTQTAVLRDSLRAAVHTGPGSHAAPDSSLEHPPLLTVVKLPPLPEGSLHAWALFPWLLRQRCTQK